MIKTVVREHHWAPTTIDALFIDAIDHHGLEYHYNDIRDMHNDLKPKEKK